MKRTPAAAPSPNRSLPRAQSGPSATPSTDAEDAGVATPADRALSPLCLCSSRVDTRVEVEAEVEPSIASAAANSDHISFSIHKLATSIFHIQ